MSSIQQFWRGLQQNAGALGVFVSGGAAISAGAWTIASLRKEIEMKGKEIEKTELAWKKEIEKTELAWKKEVADLRAEYMSKLLDLGFHGDYEKYRETIRALPKQRETVDGTAR